MRLPPVAGARLFLCLSTASLLALSGCDSQPLPPSEPAPVEPAVAKPEIEAPPTADPGADAPPSDDAKIAVDDKPQGPPAKWELRLKADDAFLAKPAPAADPTRYAKWKEAKKIKVGKSHISFATFTPDESKLIVMSEAEATIRVYDADSGKLLNNHKVPGFSKGKWERGGITYWPDPQVPGVLVGNTQGLKLLSLDDGSVLEDYVANAIWEVSWSPDGRYLFANTASLGPQTSMIRVFERKGQKLELLREISHSNRIDDIAISRDNQLAAITTYPGNAIELIDLGSGDLLWSIQAPEYCSAVAISPDKKWVAAGGSQVWLMDAKDPMARGSMATYKKLGNNVDQVEFSPSGDALVSTSYDGRVRIFGVGGLDTGTLDLLKELRHSGSANVYAADWRADGLQLLTSSGDRTVRLWAQP